MQPIQKNRSSSSAASTGSTKIKVRGYHLDLYGHVNNARYLEFLEEARWAIFDARGDLEAWAVHGLGFYVVNININYRAPACLGQVLEIRTEIDRVKNHSATLKQTVMHSENGEVIADADVTFVVVDINNRRSMPLRGDILDEIKNVFG
ncbi:MAG: thioesterase family protein [Myxococcota bacterium]|nr:thioesterase family protein [Myxococcota bacterium]